MSSIDATNAARQREIELLARVHAAHPQLADWLEQQRAAVLRQLVSTHNVPALHQAQGKAQFIEDLLDRLKNASKHLHP